MGYIYLMADLEKDDAYKIGVTRGDIEKRKKKLQTGNSGEIFLLKTYESQYPFFIEKNLHFRFASKCIKNEWFNLTPEEVKDFPKYCKEAEDIAESVKDNPFMIGKLK